MVCQVNGEYAAKNKRMEAYLPLVLWLEVKIPWCDFKRVPSSENNHADFLANLILTTEFQFRWEIPVEHILTPSIQCPNRDILWLDTSPGWRDSIIAYLKDETLPGDIAEAQKVQHMATRYILIRELLYKKSYPKLHYPYLRCLPEEVKSVMEIHDSDCGNHVGG